MTKDARRLKYAVGILELWLDPLKMPCAASGHQPGPDGAGSHGCTCRSRDIRIKTREFLHGLRKSPVQRKGAP